MFAAGARRSGPSISRIVVVARRVILKHFRYYCPRVWKIILAITAFICLEFIRQPSLRLRCVHRMLWFLQSLRRFFRYLCSPAAIAESHWLHASSHDATCGCLALVCAHSNASDKVGSGEPKRFT